MPDLKKNPNTGKHLTFDDRIEIQECLFHGVSFKGIDIDHLVRTGFDLGLTEREADRCIELLKG